MLKVTRKRSATYLTRRIVQRVWTHPGNADRRLRAVARSLRWQARKRISRGSIRVSAYGLILDFPSASSSLSNLFYFGEQFEWEVVSFCRAFLRPGDLVVDGGANVGMFTYMAWQKVRPTGRVHSFEPLPLAAQVLKHNIELNSLQDGVLLYSAAVSDLDGKASMTDDLDVSNHLRFSSGSTASRSETEVDTVRIDSVIREAPTLIKLDVEGAELIALMGCAGLICSTPRPVLIVEARDHLLQKMGASRQQVLDQLDDWGYRAMKFDPESHSLADWPMNERGGDMVFVHHEELNSVRARLQH